MSIECGYQPYIEDNFLFPPKGPFAPIPDARNTDPNCAVWETISDAVAIVNPVSNDLRFSVGNVK
jgi:hypothetical protein